jgi:AcrR family transcriptional regulator
MDDACAAGKRPSAAGRGRDAAATRQAILEAARGCFMREGYDQVGVREIAARAGADPALVNRYFGSKEGLFAAAVGGKFDLSAFIAGDRATLGDRLARYVLLEKDKPEPEEYDPLLALLRSASSDVAGRMLREALLQGFVRPLAVRLDGADAVARAELVGSTLLGLLVYRTVIGGAGESGRERLAAIVGPVLQAVIDGTAEQARGREGP